MTIVFSRASKFIVRLLLAVGSISASAEPAELSALINERLSHMQSVAAYKWLNQLPIEDLPREATVIASAQRSGLNLGITMDSSDRFFSAQIVAAKEIQQYWFSKWQQGNAPDKAPDLVNEVRPKLLTLGDQITRQLASSHTLESGTIGAEGLSEETAELIRRAANQIELYPNMLSQVLDSKVLRVGTTWDYKPFSHQVQESPTGIDIDLAKDLAASLDAKVEFVTTSWPTLMQDFNANKFDIGMSGISINLQRQRDGFFSEPYHTGGKTPIVRCEEVEKMNSFTKIDQPSTRVIVNPGGTNQKFVQASIKKASVRVHPDNRTIFYEIIEERADVMFTDAIEVRVQSNLHPELCPATPGVNFTFQQKGYLIPQDIVWKNYVDTWLNQRMGDGTLTRTFEKHGAAD